MEQGFSDRQGKGVKKKQGDSVYFDRIFFQPFKYLWLKELNNLNRLFLSTNVSSNSFAPIKIKPHRGFCIDKTL